MNPPHEIGFHVLSKVWFDRSSRVRIFASGWVLWQSQKWSRPERHQAWIILAACRTFGTSAAIWERFDAESPKVQKPDSLVGLVQQNE